MRRPVDPVVSLIVLLAAVAAGGLLAVSLAWRGVAASANLADQLAFLVSGGVGGLAVVGFAVGVLVIHSRRVGEARRRADFDEVIGAARTLLAVARQDLESPKR